MEKTEKCDHEEASVSDTFGIITPCPATYYLQVGVPALLSLATKAYF